MIEKDDLDIDMAGNYFVLVRYTFKANGRSIIKVLYFIVRKIQSLEDIITEPELPYDDNKTFDGVNETMKQLALNERERLRDEGEFEN